MTRRWILALLIALQIACGKGDISTPTAPDNAAPPEVVNPVPPAPPAPVAPMRPLQMPLRVVNGVVTDAAGLSRILGYSDFPALRIFEDDQPEELSTLRAARSAGYQFVRVAYTLAENETQDGGYWRGAHVHPNLSRRQLIPFARAAKAAGIKLHLFGAYNWCKDTAIGPRGCKDAEIEFAREMFTALRDAGLEDEIALLEWRNEWNLTSPWGTGPDSYEVYRRWSALARSILPSVLVTMGSPGEDDPLIRTTFLHPLDLASIDGMRGMSGPLYMKHANGFYYRGRFQGGYGQHALWVTEPTGPQGIGGDVYIPLDDRDYLLGLYGTYLVTAQTLTFFNGPAVRHRRPIDSTWGFYELPRLLANIPEDIGTYRGPTWFTKGSQFVAVLAEEWGEHKCPDYPRCRAIKSWRFVNSLGGLQPGGNGPIVLTPGWKAGIFLGEWQ